MLLSGEESDNLLSPWNSFSPRQSEIFLCTNRYRIPFSFLPSGLHSALRQSWIFSLWQSEYQGMGRAVCLFLSWCSLCQISGRAVSAAWRFKWFSASHRVPSLAVFKARLLWPAWFSRRCSCPWQGLKFHGLWGPFQPKPFQDTLILRNISGPQFFARCCQCQRSMKRTHKWSDAVKSAWGEGGSRSGLYLANLSSLTVQEHHSPSRISPWRNMAENRLPPEIRWAIY